MLRATSFIFYIACMLSLFLAGCGGGSSDGGAAVVDNTPPAARLNAQARLDFTCDNSRSLGPPIEGTSNFVTEFHQVVVPAGTTTFTETWQVSIGGTNHTLNTFTTLPPASSGRNGVVMILHGNASEQATLPISVLRSSNEDLWLQKGYAIVYVARRGNFGSSGARLGSDRGYVDADRTSFKVDLIEYNASFVRYQSASMNAALTYMSMNSRFQNFLHSIILIGASGGADTALFTAAESIVFQAAVRKGVIRFTGNNSQDYLRFSDELIADRGSIASVATRVKVPTLWYAGSIDPISYAGELACDFRLYTARSSLSDRFVIVSGMGHGGWGDIFSTATLPSLSTYMRSAGFSGF